MGAILSDMSLLETTPTPLPTARADVDTPSRSLRTTRTRSTPPHTPAPELLAAATHELPEDITATDPVDSTALPLADVAHADDAAANTRSVTTVDDFISSISSANTCSVTTVDDFISSISSEIETPILQTRPKLWVSQQPDYSIVPRRSLRLADKPKASNPEVQATRIMLKKMGKDLPPPSSDESGARRFKETFGGNLSATKKEATRELFPARKRFGSRRSN
jgi:hypothetical protein